jgi:hypothetical protein
VLTSITIASGASAAIRPAGAKQRPFHLWRGGQHRDQRLGAGGTLCRGAGGNRAPLTQALERRVVEIEGGELVTGVDRE